MTTAKDSFNFQSAWRLIASYWFNNNSFGGIGLLLFVLLMTGIMIGIDVGMSYWHNNFYNALQEYNQKAIIKLLLIFFIIAFIDIVLGVYRYYLEQIIKIKWRKWLTEHFIVNWLSHNSYYWLEKFYARIDNPDQRIQEDIEILISQSLALLIGLLESITTLGAFIYILWSLSPVVHFTVGHMNLQIHGYLVLVALIYAIVGSYTAHRLGRSLIHINTEQQKREANLRFAAISVRNNSEAIALSSGERYIISSLQHALTQLLENWRVLVLRQKILLWFNSGYNQISIIIPILVALPDYLNKKFLLGGFMQSCTAFQSIQNSLSFFVNFYNNIVIWSAALIRLTNLAQQLQLIAHMPQQHQQILYHFHERSELILRNVIIETPDGRRLFQDINFTFAAEQNYLLTGPPGLGKSTLIKVLAQVWPFAAGEVIFPSKQKILYFPQQPYFPSGTIRSALLFPAMHSTITDAELQALLVLCKLHKWDDLLFTTDDWLKNFSLGELQCLNFVRILIHKPDVIFLDESTSALDLHSERYFYNLISNALPHLRIISVGHRMSLKSLHHQVLDLGQFAA